VICTNPAQSWINQHQCRDILSRLDFLVVQDMYHTTETAQLAHLVLPAAGWGEKEGTFINSERRIGLIKQVRRAPGLALSDFRIFQLVAEAWGCGDMFHRFSSPAAVFDIIKECSAGQACDFTGIDGYQALEAAGGVQWPWPAHSLATEADGAEAAGSERRLFEDGRFLHADGRARFMFEDPRPMPERTSPRYPFLLLSGRGSAAEWHTRTRTRQSAVLRKLAPEYLVVEVNPHDAAQLGIGPNERIVVESQRGRVTATAVLTHTIAPGQVFLPMHDAQTNRLTYAAFDPESHQPAYKSCAVRLVRTRC